MRSIWAICKREFASYFVTPIGYVVTGIFAVVSGMAFTMSLFNYAKISQDPGAYAYPTVPDFEEAFLSPFLVFAGLLVMFLSPLITMRLFAEEKHRGTIELLLTQPLRDRDIIFGKFLAALGVLAAMVGVLILHVLVISSYAEIEAAVLVFGLFTVFLMGMAFVSMGMFVSSITNNQITSGTLTFGFNLIFYVVGVRGSDLEAGNPAPESWPETVRGTVGFFYEIFRQLLGELAVDAHAQDMAQGIFAPVDIAYYLLFSAFFVFLTFRALESRHWKG